MHFIFQQYTSRSLHSALFVNLLVQNLQGASSLACARRGWVYVDIDRIECEACGAHLTFPALSVSMPQEGAFLQYCFYFNYLAFVIDIFLHYTGSADYFENFSLMNI